MLTVPRRAIVLTLMLALALASLIGAFGVVPAEAATPPVLQRDATDGVTADVLPTAQINPTGWVEDQAIKGDTVFAGGKFSSARPAGSASGSNESARSNLLAYSLSTGVLNAGFHPVVDGEVRVLALSPDKSRLYVGGDFTKVDGTTRNRLVAFNTSTGKVDPTFAVNLNGPVYAISATSTTVYVGGQFTSANGNNRGRLAAFRASDGGLSSGWTPATDGSSVKALLVAPGGRVVAGGSFKTLKSGSTTVTADGSASLDPSTGKPGTWKVTSVVKQGGTGASVLSLHTDGTNVYGSGYRYGTSTANYEGVWAANPVDGSIVWLADCHGDTYDTTVLSGVVYTATHQHDCSNIGGYPEQTPTRIERRGTAFTTTARGTVAPNSLIPATYSSFPGYPAPALINWFPDFKNPTCSTSTSCLYANQPTNTIESSGDYVVVGGQFPTVNGVAQQGLARFAKPSVAPKKDGPRTYNGTGPTVRAVASNVMRVTAAPGDRDNLVLSRVELWRTDKSSPVWSADNLTAPWWRTTVAYTDTDVSAGKTYVYYLKMTDPDGNTTTSGQGYAKTPTSGTVIDTTYSNQVVADNPSSYWRLDDPAGSTVATDWVGNEDLTLAQGVNLGGAGYTSADPGVTTSGSTNASAAPGEATRAPQTFSAEAWFKTTATAGGPVIGYGNKPVGKSEIHDRQVYLTQTGQLSYSVNASTTRTISSSKAYNDGKWHQVVASLSSGSGMALYVDGAKVASYAAVTSAQDYVGYWRIAGDAVPGTGGTWLKGAVDDVSVYPTALSAGQVADHYTDATGKSPVAAPAAAFTTDCSSLVCAYDASQSTPMVKTEADPTIKGYSWSFGDGTKASGPAVKHTYKKASSYTVALTVTNSDGMDATVTQSVEATGNSEPVARFTSKVKSKKVSVDAKSSTDSDGTVKKYLWDFGDGTTSTKKKVSHSYVGTGSYGVTLTVTDDEGSEGTTVKNVVIGKALGLDGFGRSSESGWGKADKGGSWSTDPSGAFAVAGGQGTLTLADKGDDAVAVLPQVSSKKANVVSELTVDKATVSTDTTAGYVLRHTASGEYRATLVPGDDGTTLLVASRVVNGAEKVLKSVEVKKVTLDGSGPLRVRATISSADKAKITMTVWPAGTKEPKAQLTTSDSTKALRRSGSVGVRGSEGSAGDAPVVLGYDNLLVTSS
jgi:PKD repeat protein